MFNKWKPRSCEELYSELIFGDVSNIEKYKNKIVDLISKDFIKEELTEGDTQNETAEEINNNDLNLNENLKES